MPNNVFNCLIEATRGNDTVYYAATVEDDGFIYFNDDRFFRVETPTNIHDIEQSGQTITITGGIQSWYVVRDVWIYANVFDQLVLSSIVLDIDKQDLQTGLDTIVGYINDLGDTAQAHNGTQLYNLYQAVIQIASDLNNQGVTVTTPSQGSIYTTYNHVQNYTLQ